MLKNKHIQSILASSKIRLLKLSKNNPVIKHQKEYLFKTKDATLQGFYTENKKSDKLAILIHGWEGSSISTYIQLLANALYQKGSCSIFRLNLRDHGDTHHLNRELFHSCRLNEVVELIEQIMALKKDKKPFLMGFSLGGNFSLRVAGKINKKEKRINKTFAISPPIVPKNSMLAIEKSRLYSNYFLKKWKRSLEKKEKLFPQDFKGSAYKEIKSLDKLTEMLIIQHTEYDTTDDYFEGYQITEKLIDSINTSTHIITSKDDPVIPYEDFQFLAKKQNIQLISKEYGGHCGFIKNWRMDSWVEDYILKEIEDE